MSDSVEEDFNSKSMQTLQASVMLAQELMRVVNARLQASVVEEEKQVKQLKAITDVALDNARKVAGKLGDEQFYTLAPKTDLYDAYVCAHSFAFDPYCAGKVEEANQRLGLEYAPGSLTDADCVGVRACFGVESGTVVAEKPVSMNAFNRFYQVQYETKGEKSSISFLDRVKGLRGFDRGVLILEGTRTRLLAEVVSPPPVHKPVPLLREHSYTRTRGIEAKPMLKI